jgi:phenylalanyl-tRNA synthetase beta chain
VIASLRWLSDLLGTPLEAEAVRDRLAMLCAPVDAMETIHGGLERVVVGLVLDVARHPNADRLSLCKVSAGGEVLGVVCGAPNVTAGKRYPFAAVGVTLPNGVTLERRKIRGEYSEGMLCSAKELGLGEDSEGILELATEAAPGTPLLEVLPVADTRFDIDVTPNRPDLLCHAGLARELGAVLGRPVRLPAIPGAAEALPPRAVRAAGASGETAGVRVAIEDAEGCPRYAAAVLRGVTVGPSPAWLKDRLAAVGARSINNVVDATNYVLQELNQPLHAFDLAKLAGPAVVIRRGRAGEALVTLDGVRRTVGPAMTVIADAETAQAVAGVMGGAASEVSATTTDLLLECAYFEPRRLRATRRALALSTEASYRYERGMDPEALPANLERAVALILAVAGGRLDGTPVDVCPAPIAPRTVTLRDERLAHVLGIAVPRADAERALTSLGCVVLPREGRLTVQVPSWRPDLEREVDLIEEVARIVGYDRFPEEMRPFRPSVVPDEPAELVASVVRMALTGLGLHEAVTVPLGPRQGERSVEVLNPLSQEEAFLREALLPGLVRRVEHNWRLSERDVRLFEIGRTFAPGKGALPVEEIHVAGVVTGGRRPRHWSEPAPPDVDVFDAKALLEAAAAVACRGATLAPEGERLVARLPHGTVVGWAGSLDADRPAWAAPLVGFEVLLRADATAPVAVRPRPRSPAVERDVALVLPDALPAAEVEAVLRSAAGPLLETVWVFDEYRGASLAAGQRSVAWRLVFRAGDRTLREAEVDAALTRAVTEVETRCGVRRREA